MPKFRLEQLRVQIMMIKYELLAEQVLVERSDQEDEIWRIAGVNHIETSPPKYLE
jgi:hypothetical protein